MENLDITLKGAVPFEKTINLKEVLGRKVISKNGRIVGRIHEIRMADNGTHVAGVIISRGLFKSKIFLSEGYINRLTEDSIVLNIDPFVLFKNLKVVSSEGEIIGKVVDFVRGDNTNDVVTMIVKGFMRGKFNVSSSFVKSVGYSIILKQNYEPPKKHFWKRT